MKAQAKPKRKKVLDPFYQTLIERRDFLRGNYHRSREAKIRSKSKTAKRQSDMNFGHLMEIEEIIALYIESENLAG